MVSLKTKERHYLEKVVSLGCIACKKAGYDTPLVEIHHIREGTEKRNHFKTIPLCPAHHRIGGYGTAVHAGKKAFEAQFGTEQELLAEVNEELTA